MKKCLVASLVVAMSVVSLPAFSQKDKDKADTSAILDLPGDNLDLYAVLSLFQKSKTIEAFEKALNEEKTGINNLDLNLDKKVDFIKVVTKKVDSSFTFTLQVDVTKKETQDVAVILLDKNKDKISLQIVGDETLYGEDYVIEPKGNSPITPNPAYTGPDPVVVTEHATTTTVVVQSAPIVQYVYSPAYVPYYPPYYYGYYPPYFAAFTIMAVGIYRHNNWYHHGGYYGGHYGGNNNIIINNGNRNNINHNTVRNTSNTVSNNMNKGKYGDRNTGRTGNGSASTRPSTGNRMSGGASASTRPSTGNRMSGGASPSTRPATTNRSSTPSMSSSSRGSSMGGGRSMGGGGGRMGGGGGRRR